MREASGIHAMLFDLADVADFFGFALLGDQLVNFSRADLALLLR